MSKLVLSDGAKAARADYYRKRYKRDPAKHRQAELNMWEKKARALYENEYIPPKKDGELSAQAAELRRKYNAEYRKKNRDRIRAYRKEYMKTYTAKHRDKLREKQKKYMHDYWERKAIVS